MCQCQIVTTSSSRATASKRDVTFDAILTHANERDEHREEDQDERERANE